jgi:hypothetical protein
MSTPDTLAVPPETHPTEAQPTPEAPDMTAARVAAILSGALSASAHVVDGAIYEIRCYDNGPWFTDPAQDPGTAQLGAQIRHVRFAAGDTWTRGVRIRIDFSPEQHADNGDLIAAPK